MMEEIQMAEDTLEAVTMIATLQKFIEDDELIEVTPKNLRLRKRQLDHNLRKREAKQMKIAVGN